MSDQQVVLDINTVLGGVERKRRTFSYNAGFTSVAAKGESLGTRRAVNAKSNCVNRVTELHGALCTGFVLCLVCYPSKGTRPTHMIL